jgi:glycosyltransferase involved in cell wall biosynthesis
MATSNIKYVVISPVRDEAAHLPRTIESVARQTVRPVEWIIVNDGSSDKTGAIIDEGTRKFPWLRAIHRSNRGFRKPGGGVVEAFNEGYKAIQHREWDFLVKLDGDLSFEPDYFQVCFEHFEREPNLGVGGGAVCDLLDGKLCVEESPAFHVRGATKIYRRACWDALGGFWPGPGWDTIDEVTAQRLGWRTRTFRDLRLVQHRPTGQADGFWRVLVKYGRANYSAGYHPLFMLCKCGRRLVHKPYLVGSLGLLYGYVTGYTKRVPRLEDKATVAYLRQQQLNRLFGAPSIWR